MTKHRNINKKLRFRKGKKAFQAWQKSAIGGHRMVLARRYMDNVLVGKEWLKFIRETHGEEIGWECACGNVQGGDRHCKECGAEPAWGCDCLACEGSRQPALEGPINDLPF